MQMGDAASGPTGRISRTNGLPLYRQIADDVRAGIRSGRWEAGSQLPPESELVGMYGASRLTVRKSLELLEHEGLLSRQPGRGTFVLAPIITGGPRFFGSFTDELAHRGIVAGSQVLHQAVVEADEDVAGHLGLSPGEAVVKLERVRTGDGQPICFQRAWLPARLFPGLERHDLTDGSLYDLIDREYGVRATSGDEVFSLDHIDDASASAALKIEPGSAVLHLEKISHQDATPIELLRAYLRGDRYRIQLRLGAG
jgi:GntR family transcriptional regulator